MKKVFLFALIAAFFLAVGISGAGVSPNKMMGINVVLNTEISNAILTDLANYGTVLDVFHEINALTMRTKLSHLETIQSLPYVAAANPDRERQGIPIDTVPVDNFNAGLSTWNLDTIDVTDYGFANRVVDYDGAGVYVAVLDTGLVDTWRQYFPQERIATEYAICFGGGGGNRGWVSTQPNKWEHDTNSHGTHVTSTILGYNFYGTPINGVAPMASVIPVKVLNQTGWGWTSAISRGILYVAVLKEKEIPFINLLIVTMSAGKYRKTLQNAYSQAEKVPFIAVEYFLGIFDLFGCLFNSLIRYYSPIRLKGDLRMDNFDISYLVKEAIKKDSLSAQFFDTLRIYYAARSMVRKISLSSFYYPFENRSFEKMAVQAIKENAPEAKVVGYQHASLSLSHTNFLLTKEEAKITPLPDTIMTMGRITKDIMKNMGNFPSDLLKTGCALRQKINIEKLKDKKENIRNILVVLATGIEEYVKVLMFLEEAFKGTNQFYNIWIRPHPVFKLEDAIKIIGKPNFTFHKTEKETLSECLEWADAVMYVHSTVAIEALSKGMPVMCINIDNALNADPLFDFSSFKWQVNSPHELETVVNEINTLSEDDFRLRQAKAVEYVKDYFYPVNQDTLAKFM